MAVSASSYEAKASSAAVDLLAGSSTFQALVGAINATAAKAFIVEDYSGSADAGSGDTFLAVDGTAVDYTATWAYVRLLGTETEQRAFQTRGRSGSVLFFLNLPVDATDTPAEQFRRARNAQGDIRADMETAIGGASTFLWADFATPEVIKCDPSDDLPESFEIQIEMSWRDLP